MITVNKKKIFIVFAALTIITASFALGIHNATLYNPSHGFDGSDHLFYIKYVNKYWKIPPPRLAPETHQSPLYYFLGALVMKYGGTWKAAQYINIFVLWMIIGMVGISLWKVFKKIEQVLIGMFALASLPMLNIFPAMLSNELLNTFWIVSATVSTLFIISAKTKQDFVKSLLWLIISLVFGYWTKETIILIVPTVFIALLIRFFNKKNDRFFMLTSFLIAFIVVGILSAPVYFRAKNAKRPNAVEFALKTNYSLKPIDYYFRLDWIPKVDMYNTQYYSLIGAAWNSFWTDGHNAITPFITFHKKSFILWSLGFLLLPICLYGLKKRLGIDKKSSLIINFTGIAMLSVYVFANLSAQGHYSSARLTYEMGIVVPYAFGIASASKNQKLKIPILILLSIQFIVMVSFFWIQSWWHVVK